MSHEPLVLALQEIDPSHTAIVGGKAAHLGALSRMDGIRVPPGFCVTTHAFRRILAEAAPAIDSRIDRLSRLTPDDQEAIRSLGAEVRGAIEAVAIPPELAAAVNRALSRVHGADAAYAVRSSATAEDLPTASFAGQQDSYLNVVGSAAILRHISRCWASLFTDRAVTYRLRNGFDHRAVHMGVVVQLMVSPHSSGILFTADPISGNRKVVAIEATLGLGESLVSGLVNADRFEVRDGALVAETSADRSAGTPTLTAAQAVRLAELGRRIEAHFGRPQDIEWCLAGDGFHFVQSRPITTLFPIPALPDQAGDQESHVYISVGHQQMMTDPMKPLGLSFWQLTTPRTMNEAAGRLFVDVGRALASPASRAALLDTFGKSDPLIKDALQTIADRGFVPSVPDAPPPAAPPAPPPPIETDPAIVAALIKRGEDTLAALKRDIATKSGVALFDFILENIQELKRPLFSAESLRAIMAGFEATWWLNERLQLWLGEKNAADTLAQSAPNNVTSEMGLALLDVADVLRPHPEVVAFLSQEHLGDDVLERLPALAGGREARAAIEAYLEKYGMRCAGEIDITRTRFRERPAMLVPMILNNVRNFSPGAGKQRFAQGREEASKKEAAVLARLRTLPDGEQKAEDTKRMIDRLRTFIGYREYPKYGMVSRYFVYKQALLREAERLVEARVLREKEDIFYLRFNELREVVRTHQVDERLIDDRKEAFRSYRALTPPRVLTSDGEAIAGSYRRSAADLPAGALIGLAVSAGVIEGRARVILDMTEAKLEPGDILVTAFTDPSWTPLFVAIKGLVTEVGGLMTHGAVIAREYGLPAVVGVERATKLIRDGQRIRVNGTDGTVEVLS